MDVKTVCLGVLTLGEASGYEIRKAFEDGPFRYFTDAGFGSIYPALGKLHDEGLVDCTSLAQDKRPDKKVYSITPAGKTTLANALRQPPGPDKLRSDFLFALFFEHLLSPELIAAAVDGRIGWYRDRLAHMEACAGNSMGPGPTFVNGLGQAIYGAALAYLEENRDALIAAAGGAAAPRAAE